MEQIERIRRMERLLNGGNAALSQLMAALEEYRAALPGIRELEAYYQSEQWMQDVEDERKGKLPEELRCGVLSEDAVWNLLTDCDRLREILREA